MQIIETNVYTFDELSDKAKEKARDWYKEGDDMPFLSEYMNETASELLANAGIRNVTDMRVYYSLSYSQGDGAMIEFVGEWKAWTIKVKQCGMYSHERSTDITLQSTKTGEHGPDEKLKKFEEDIYVPHCRKLARAGYEYIDAEQSNENVDENIRANEYTFTIDGVRFG